ncbi:MAG: acetyl-CoA carboxylase biotin carboxylase subunit [Arcobacter sp.]|jgi:pyruvate carboxylase subunit A|uniref:Pyruvate carboxylase, subunit A n=1 Tax=Arcobacter defluvii TaxID=873191 RepID=A0AAE7BCH0_9BACT|nr:MULTISPECIES: acetyl-CoA carboxylase biotin carboxylase subunit [Arcobacter]MDY3199843.1 acetyl-CoA carboxylase biotin carboxylase subunit [Arcobacter sp.]QKF76796.1 pyruvate carboxylase, subunit A [Arcobacter defluvii]RXI33865.1 acetyl-CoA carboxylase biotin carboxylase subunit [Arcobacter defluvii]BAK72613.1 acetyl CoA carboxylase biotin carboxylase subunit [Arcobacter sp. L]
MKKISKVLIANRGEIALRIIRACKELEISSVAIFSEIDVEGIWVRKADECYPIMGDVVQAYLDYEKIISIAKKANCDAIHPGYGFLSENADFAKACEDNGLIFIGPKPEHIELFGDKMASKVAMKKVGVPVLEGTDEPIINVEEGARIAKEIGFPIIIKAAFGGGGRGMRIVRAEKEFKDMFESATNEAKKYFGRGEAFIEKYVENPRHIEIQIIADKYGNVLHLGERDCSIQRRHQKVIEIAPSPRLDSATRKELYRIATKAMFKLGYESVGTIEFLVDESNNIFFIEMNTRVQVEHPVTETITGVDIIQRMIEIAEGDKLQFLQEDVHFRGYAIEFRINAENPQKNFMPSVGTISKYLTPGGPGVRIDTSIYTGYKVPANYDSMIGKLIVWALDWKGAVKKAKRALDEFYIEGFPTNIPLHREIVRDQDFIDGKFTTNYLDKKMEIFTLHSEDNIKKEEEKVANIMKLIETINKNNLKVKH